MHSFRIHWFGTLLCVLAAAGLRSAFAEEYLEGDDDDFGSSYQDEGWIEGKIKSMSIREKIGQMFMIDLRTQELTPELKTHLSEFKFGNVIFFEHNLRDQDQVRLFTSQLQTMAMVELGIPMFIALDQEGGRVSRLSGLTTLKSVRHSARTVGNAFQRYPERTRKALHSAARVIAGNLRHLGFNMNLAPVLDMTDDTSSYIYDRSYANNPRTVASLAGTVIDAMADHGIVSTGKHFPNLSTTITDSHLGLPILNKPLSSLKSHEMRPFELLRNKLGAVMVGHILIPQIDDRHPASISKKSTGILRSKWGYEGLIVMDDIKMKALTNNYSLTEILMRAIDADIDLIIASWGKGKHLECLEILEKSYRKGFLTDERLDRSVRRILRAKQSMYLH